MKKLPVLFATLVVLFFNMPVNAQNSEPLADEMSELLKSEPFNLGLLLQSEANFSFEDNNFNNGRRFGLGAARLRFGGTVDSDFSYVFQMEFNRQVSLLDLNLGYRFSEAFTLKAGAQKPDIGLDLMPSPGDTDFISRARLIGAMLNSREIGMSAQGLFGDFDYTLGVFNGYGMDRANDNNFMYLGKLGYTAENESGQSLYAGVNGTYNQSRLERVGNTGLIAVEDRLTYGAFLKLDSANWFGAVEFMETDFEMSGGGDETITGFYATIGHRITERSELLVRWDNLSYDLNSFRDSDLFILGWNHQATRLISFQVNLLIQNSENDENYGLAGIFQFQF